MSSFMQKKGAGGAGLIRLVGTPCPPNIRDRKSRVGTNCGQMLPTLRMQLRGRSRQTNPKFLLENAPIFGATDASCAAGTPNHVASVDAY